jgi:cellobiose phosphorylase
MLGVRPEVGGLRIDPCLPSDWTEAAMDRHYRGAQLSIQIQKPKGICRGHVQVLLDGVALPENLVPPQVPGSRHQVDVIITTAPTQQATT